MGAAPDSETLVAQARAWIADDPDQNTRAELEDILGAVEAGDEAALADLADRFDGTLEFGTAGLRGAVAAGPNRMNRAVVSRAAAGLAAYLKDTGATGPVVVGKDARHGSDDFAQDTAEVMTGAGIPVLLLLVAGAWVITNRATVAALLRPGSPARTANALLWMDGKDYRFEDTKLGKVSGNLPITNFQLPETLSVRPAEEVYPGLLGKQPPPDDWYKALPSEQSQGRNR